MNNQLTLLRDKLSNGKCVIGTFLKTTDPAFIENAALGGFDFVIIDQEHGLASTADLHNLVRAAETGGCDAIVRVAANRPELIQKALDSGAAGVQVPGIHSADAALAVVQASYFAPKGMRGVCRYVRPAAYSRTSPADYFAQSQNVLTVIHLEGKAALENIDQIAGVDGVDIFFIGPWDLSQSLGIPGQVDHPIMLDAIRKITRKLKAKGKVLGTFVDNMNLIRSFAQSGIQYIAYSTDSGIFHDACASKIHEIQQEISSLSSRPSQASAQAG